jgi:ribosomal protein S14
MAKKYKAPSYIRACDLCGQGKGYHSEGVNYRLCDSCFRIKCDKQLEEYLAKGGK